MVTSPEELKALSESKIVHKDPNAKAGDERLSLAERMRSKWHNTLYSTPSSSQDQLEKKAV